MAERAATAARRMRKQVAINLGLCFVLLNGPSGNKWQCKEWAEFCLSFVLFAFVRWRRRGNSFTFITPKLDENVVAAAPPLGRLLSVSRRRPMAIERLTTGVALANPTRWLAICPAQYSAWPGSARRGG